MGLARIGFARVLLFFHPDTSTEGLVVCFGYGIQQWIGDELNERLKH
jgi:hypothetical protein